MLEEEEGDTNREQAFQRPLKRSKTINVPGLIDSTQDPPKESQQPKSSCQALRHAVSALTCIDDFYLEELGSGFFANVYKATHKVTNEEMVMKINKDMANRPSALREVQLMNKLCHPNILRFLGVCVHEGQLHALTEYISGGTLDALLADKEEELPWTLRIKLSLDVARGIYYIHNCGVMHRDLTSKNILVKKGENRNYTAIIADFGLATRIPDENATVRLNTVGSPWWMAPEVVTGKFYDERADWFSFGIINMELTTRVDADPERMPRTNSFGVDYLRICELVEYCPLDFLQLAFKCCQVQPDKRPSSSFTISTLEKIYSSLCDSSLTNSGRFHKRSKSEDNIIQSLDSTNSPAGAETFMTAHVIAQAMSQDDPHYSPASDNPFASISRMKDGRKLMDFYSRKLSVTSPSSTDSNAANKSSVFVFPIEDVHSQSLPSSPVMLRKAAEKRHQASLHGSEAVKVDIVERRLTRSFCLEVEEEEEEEEALEEIFAADRRARFSSNRTMSLGSLDSFRCGGRKTNQKKKKQSILTSSDQRGFCNRNSDILKESSFEDNVSFDQSKHSSVSNGFDSFEVEMSPPFEFENAEKDDHKCIDSNGFYAEADVKRMPLSEKRELNVNPDDKPVLAMQTESFESEHFGKDPRNFKNKINFS